MISIPESSELLDSNDILAGDDGRVAFVGVTSASMISEVVAVSIDAIMCGIIAAPQELDELDRPSRDRSDRRIDGDNEPKVAISLALIKSLVREVLKAERFKELSRMHAVEQQSTREESCGDRNQCIGRPLIVRQNW